MSDQREIALELLKLGLHVFPCFESGERAKAPRTEHGFLEASNDPAQINTWWDATPEALIGVATGMSGLITLDIDDKPDKNGLESIVDAGLRVPHTYFYETLNGGFHYVYAAQGHEPGPTKDHALEDGRKLRGVDRRSGGSYFIWWDEAWPDSREEFGPAPEWFLNSVGTQGEGWGGTLNEWFAGVGGGRMSPLMRAATERIPLDDFGRGELWTRMVHIIRLATVDGEPGAGDALEFLRKQWLRGPWDTPKYQKEWAVSLANCIFANGGVRPQAESAVAEREKAVDYSWFDQTPTLAHIRQWSQAQLSNPWAGLLAVLTRLSADLPPQVVLPALGSLPKASLNQFSAIVGRSGAGKSALIASLDEMLWPRPQRQLDPALTFAPSSGEGLIARFVEMRRQDNEWVMVQVATQGLALVDEIDSLQALAGRSGSILLSTLKSLWSGGYLGSANATKDRQRELEAHSYRLALLAGIQPGLGEILFNREAALGGLPQRFVYAEALDPSITRTNIPRDPGPLPRMIHPDLPFDRVFGLDTWQPQPGNFYAIPLEESVTEDLLDNQVAIRLQDDNALNGHWMLAKLKIAALLALLHGEKGVSKHWFDQAQTVMEHSDSTREMLQEKIRHAQREEVIAAGRADAERALASDAAIERRLHGRVLDLLAETGAEMTLRDLKRRVSKRQQEVLPLVLDALVRQGKIGHSPGVKRAGTPGLPTWHELRD